MPESLPPPRLRSPDRAAVFDATPIDGLLDSDHQARVVGDFCRQLDVTSPTDPLRALADVRVEHLDFLDALLTHSAAVLREQGLVDLNRDGTRVRAS